MGKAAVAGEHPRHVFYTLWLLSESSLVTVLLLAAIAQLRGQVAVWLPVLLLGFWVQRLYMVGHEASHRKLWPRSLWLNDVIGQLFLLPILVPVSVFRQIHFFHHGHNRRDVRTSALDIYIIGKKFSHVQRWWSYLLWYVAVFGGGFFVHSLVSILILLVIPPHLARRISPAFRGWTWRKQLHALVIFSAGIALHVAVGLVGGGEAWLYFCGFPLLCFAWIYSVLMYIYHYRTSIGTRVGDNARSIRRQFLSAWWLLNFNEHRVHHLRPSLPWYSLPAHRHLPRASKEPTLGLLQAVLQQLRGPTLIDAEQQHGTHRSV